MPTTVATPRDVARERAKNEAPRVTLRCNTPAVARSTAPGPGNAGALQLRWGAGAGVERATGFEPATFSLGMGRRMKPRQGPLQASFERPKTASGGHGGTRPRGNRRLDLPECWDTGGRWRTQAGRPVSASSRHAGLRQPPSPSSCPKRIPLPPAVAPIPWRGSDGAAEDSRLTDSDRTGEHPWGLRLSYAGARLSSGMRLGQLSGPNRSSWNKSQHEICIQASTAVRCRLRHLRTRSRCQPTVPSC